MSNPPIILFDGVCNFCNGMVNFVIRNDRRKIFRFAALQSKTGTSLIREYNIAVNADSVILIEDGKAYTLSTAAMHIARRLDWPARMIAALSIFPAFVRDPVYKWVAKNRYKWFGKKEACMVPTPDIRERFLE